MELHELTAKLNHANERITALERELAATSLERSWQWVHVRKRELTALYRERARLEELLR